MTDRARPGLGTRLLARLAWSLKRRPGYGRAARAMLRDELVQPTSARFREDVLRALRAAEFEAKEFAGAPRFEDWDALLRATLPHVDPTRKVWVELGVASGRTIHRFAADAATLAPQVEIHGFDSFEGLPEDWKGNVGRGAFAQKAPRVKDPRIRLHVGWFDDTLPPFAKTLDGPLGFVHVDCDLYSSTKTAFDALGPFIVPGTVLLFDEYWNYPDFDAHEIKAFREFLDRTGYGFRYLGYNANHEQASVVLTASSPR